MASAPRLAALMLTIVLATPLAACGSDDEGGDGSRTGTETAATVGSADPTTSVPAGQARTTKTETSGAWTYSEVRSHKGEVEEAQRVAAVADGDVRLEFVDGEVSGESVNLYAGAAGMKCYGSGAKAKIAIDGAAPTEQLVSLAEQPSTPYRLDDPEQLWSKLDGARRLEITVPTDEDCDGGEAFTFDVSGLEPDRLPWTG